MAPAHAHWAMYAQATRLHPRTGKVARRQWIVLPPLTQTTDSSTFLMFSREQQTPENRVKWRFDRVEASLLERDLPEKLAALKASSEFTEPANRWRIQPVVTAQVTEPELKDLYADPKTPYQLLERFKKVASRRHGYTI